MSVLLFEDSFVERLRPITLCRSAYAIHCGGLRLIDVTCQLTSAVATDPRPYLRQVYDADSLTAARPTDGVQILINARLAPNVELVPIIQHLLDSQTIGAVWIADQLALAILPNSLPTSVVGQAIPSFVRESQIAELTLPEEIRDHVTLLEYPHSIVAKHQRIFTNNLKVRSASAGFTEVRPGVFVKGDTKLGESIVTDTSRGPILLESGVVVGSFVQLAGPLLIGENSTVRGHSTLHPYVSTGHTVKIGGEVESSIIEPYSNKQHHGYLGHSYLGSWVNLGAGTSNSNLKNTYGEVNMTVAGRKIPTGMRLMGCVIGDYTKTAINTSILTGRTIGVASMLYGFIAQDVPSFVNYAHQFGDISAVSLESAVVTQQRMFSRRHVTRRDCDRQLLVHVFEQTAAEREGFECRPPKLA